MPEGSTLQNSRQFWVERLKEAKDFNGTDHEYCLSKGIKLTTFNNYKRKLGFTRKTKPKPETSSAFKKVEVVPRKHASTPSPEWVARFLKELLR